MNSSVAQKDRLIRIVLSGLVLFHLSAMILCPNKSDFFYKKTKFIFGNYALPLRMYGGWTFYTAPHRDEIFFLEWETFDQAGKQIELRRIPELSYLLTERFNRIFSLADAFQG